jgi:hypothetical protein
MFYTFYQNNSGGSFDITEDLAEYVIIEASNHEEANQIAESIGIYFNGCEARIDCECCGNRWYPVSQYEGTEEPEIFGESMYNRYTLSTDAPMCIVHHKNEDKIKIGYRG